MSFSGMSKLLLAPAVAEPTVLVAPETKPASRARLPRHLALIMDGNGRWGTQRGLPRLQGHARGVEAARCAVRGCLQNGIEVLSLYAFSTLNWKRPADEVDGLMKLLADYMENEAEGLAAQGVRFRLVGGRKRLPAAVRKAADRAESITAGGQRLVLNLGVNYGGQEELTAAVRAMAREVAKGRLSARALDGSTIEEHLFTAGLPPVDLVVRTAGVRRLSNFMLWQTAYAELLFIDTLWPDFTETDLTAALDDYAGRRRTFGGLPDVRSKKG